MQTGKHVSPCSPPARSCPSIDARRPHTLHGTITAAVLRYTNLLLAVHYLDSCVGGENSSLSTFVTVGCRRMDGGLCSPWPLETRVRVLVKVGSGCVRTSRTTWHRKGDRLTEECIFLAKQSGRLLMRDVCCSSRLLHLIWVLDVD